MKRKVVMRLLCVSIASAMLVSNTAILVASEGTRTAIYNGQQVTVTLNGDNVILPDGQMVSINDCQILPEETAPVPEPTPTPEPAPEPTPEPPVTETPNTEAPVTETSDTETPDTETPDTEKPATEIPDTETPDTETPDTETPDTEKPDTETPDTETPDTETPDTETPDTETPDTETPDTETPDTETPDTETPDIETPDNSETPVPIVPIEEPAVKEESSVISNPALKDNESAPRLSVVTPSLKAGIGFYVDELKDTYQLEFSEGFAEMLTEIEREYVRASVKEAMEAAAKKAEAEQKAEEAAQVDPQITDGNEAGEVQTAEAETPEVKTPESETAEAEMPEAEEAEAAKEQIPAVEEEFVSKVQVAEDVLLEDIKAEELTVSVKNWQDVLAVYLLEQSRAGVTEFKLDDSSKERLAQLLSEMNTPTITAEEFLCEPQNIDAYIEANKETLTESEIAFLNEYVSSSFSLLCSAATGAEGFILESLGEDVSAERAQVVAAGYSLVGKIPYFWGGKSSVVGWDDRWGNPAEVTAAGTSSSGTIQNYGLDCSGFVTWAFVNGYENSAATSLIGHGTATQWAMSEPVSEEEALPGDLVFLQQPNSAGINHVGIVVGRNDDGSLIAVHCNAGQNGVTVDSAYQAGFRYVRRPLAYTDDETQTLTGKQIRLQELKKTISEENAKADSLITK